MKNNNKKIMALLAAVSLMTCSCKKEFPIEESSVKPDKAVLAEEPTEEATETATKAPKKPKSDKVNIRYAQVFFGDDLYDSIGTIHEDDAIAQLTAAVTELEPAEMPEGLVTVGEDDWQMRLTGDEYDNVLRRIRTADGWYVIDDNLRLYSDSPVINSIVADSFVPKYSAGTTVTSDGEEEYFSVECAEPDTEEEYLNAAVACTDGWLASLQGDDVEDYWRNSKYEITVYSEEEHKQKSHYLACGMVDGVKTFVCEICFNAKDSGRDTFYDKFYQEGRYTEAGTFWSGVYICGRFTYKDGKCSLVKFTTRDGSEALHSDLHGTNTTAYRTFYDFARRPDLQQLTDDSFEPYGRVTVSRNLTQTQDGKPLNIDIYAFSADKVDGGYDAIWDIRSYSNGESLYSTGLYFTDDGTGHMPDTLPEDFHLTFDNYDGDANPDYCCRYDEDEDGTYYFLDSVQSDGRLFNLSGRAFKGGIYIAGCNDPSPRLQKTESTAYVGWKKSDNGYYPTDSNGNQIVLEPFRMYSDRLYLPDDARKYYEDENTVTCFLWNNTDKPFSTDGTYDIEVMDKGEWTAAATGLKAKNTVIQPRSHTEVTYDISAIKERFDTRYRIVQKAGANTAYGEFYLDGKFMQNAELKADKMMLGAVKGTFEITSYDNSGDNIKVNSVVIKDGAKEYPCKLVPKSDRYIFVCKDMPQKVGTYTLVVNGELECGLDIMDAAEFADVKVETEFGLESIVLHVDPEKDCEVTSCKAYEWQEDESRWTDTSSWLNPDINNFSLKKGVKGRMGVTKVMLDSLDEEELSFFYKYIKDAIKDNGGKLPEEYEEGFADLGLTADFTYEEFENAMHKDCSYDAEKKYMLIFAYKVDDMVYKKYIYT